MSTILIRALKLKVLFIILAGTMLQGCAQISKATYPPDFVYLNKQEIRTTMQKMAASISNIHALLSDTNHSQDQMRDKVSAELKNIETATRELGTAGKSTNHPLIDNHLDGFRDELIAALRAVESDPPDYYPAGRLVGQCHGCHAQN